MDSDRNLGKQLLSYIVNIIKNNLISIGLIFIGLLVEHVSGSSIALIISMIFACIMILFDVDLFGRKD